MLETACAPDRAALTAGRTGDIVRGGPTKADVWVAETVEFGRVVVKDFAAKGTLVRVWGRVQIAREARFLARLGDIGIAPRLVGRIDHYALALEFIAGTPMFEHPGESARPHLAALRKALDEAHARGIVHNDLRGRENVLLRADGQGVVVLDWASAMQLKPGSLAHRLFFRALKSVDESAYLKWKDMLDPSSITREDHAAMERFRRWRWLWPFNRKGVGWKRAEK